MAVQVQSLASHPTVVQTVSGLDMEYPASQEKIEHVSTVPDDVTQQSIVSHAPAQAGALVQSDRRSMLATTHRSDENAKPDPSVSAHVRSTSQQSVTPQVPVAHVIARSLLMVYPEPQTPMAVPLPSMLLHDGLASQQSDIAQRLVAQVTERSPFKWLTPLTHDENKMPLPAPCPSILSHVGLTQQHSATMQPPAPH